MDKKPEEVKKDNINLNMDTTPALYSDFVIWNISPDGVVLNFGQRILGSNQVKVTNRVGLSRDFVKRFISDFGKNLALTEAQGQTGKSKS